ncbi:MAG: hypothetical protein U9R57_07235, partial [Thermodesulfobacteriota bacterium]|nr:hypothetical protein [Thermodesulfobacteriota bacterium]
SGHKCATGSVDFIYSQPQRSWLREDCEYIKSAEDVVQLRIGKPKLFFTEPLLPNSCHKKQERCSGYLMYVP